MDRHGAAHHPSKQPQPITIFDVTLGYAFTCYTEEEAQHLLDVIALIHHDSHRVRSKA